MSIITAFPNLLYSEFRRAQQEHKPMSNAHEAFANIKEHLDEFWDECKKKKIDRIDSGLLTELVHTATTCWRAAIDLELMESDSKHFLK